MAKTRDSALNKRMSYALCYATVSRKKRNVLRKEVLQKANKSELLHAAIKYTGKESQITDIVAQNTNMKYTLDGRYDIQKNNVKASRLCLKKLCCH